jgi:hypothetical protein
MTEMSANFNELTYYLSKSLKAALKIGKSGLIRLARFMDVVFAKVTNGALTVLPILVIGLLLLLVIFHLGGYLMRIIL